MSEVGISDTDFILEVTKIISLQNDVVIFILNKREGFNRYLSEFI